MSNEGRKFLGIKNMGERGDKLIILYICFLFAIGTGILLIYLLISRLYKFLYI